VPEHDQSEGVGARGNTAAAIGDDVLVKGPDRREALAQLAGGGYLTLFPSGAAQPDTSSVNFVPSQDRANLAFITLNGSGQSSVFAFGASALLLFSFAIGPDSLTLEAARPGRTLLHVHFSPYWTLSLGSGCVAPAGSFTEVTLRRPGPAQLKISFAVDRIVTQSARCTSPR